ncbi:unnamed protein product [Microthlaspi erraticum]|nr:unnamed protein product [Microthlaspi erraticum]
MWHLVAFRGKFYASLPGEVLVIDPYSLDVTLTIPSSLPLEIVSCLVPSGNDELFQVKVIASPTGEVYLGQAILRVSKLDEEAGKWVVVTDIGDRVLLIHGEIENVFFSAKELPDGCGLSRNSILITDEPRGESFLYKYGVDTGNAEDDLSFWRSSRDTCVRNISSSPMAYHLRVEQNLTLET